MPLVAPPPEALATCDRCGGDCDGDGFGGDDDDCFGGDDDNCFGGDDDCFGGGDDDCFLPPSPFALAAGAAGGFFLAAMSPKIGSPSPSV